MVLAAGYLLYMYGRIVFGEVSPTSWQGLGDHLTDMTPVEILTLVPLATLVVVFGVQPGPAPRPRPGHRRRDTSRAAESGAAIALDTTTVAGAPRPHRHRHPRPARLGADPRRRHAAAARRACGRRGRPLTTQDLVAISPAHPRGPDGRGGPRRRPHLAGPRPDRHRDGVAGAAADGRRDGRGRQRAGDRLRRLVHGRRADDVPRHPVHLDRRDDDPVRARLPARRATCRSPSSRSILIFAMTGAMLIAGVDRPAAAVPRPRAHGPAGLPAGGLPQDRLVLDRGRDQVLPARLVQLGDLPVRAGVRVGPDRDDARRRRWPTALGGDRRRQRRRCRRAWRWASPS